MFVGLHVGYSWKIVKFIRLAFFLERCGSLINCLCVCADSNIEFKLSVCFSHTTVS